MTTRYLRTLFPERRRTSELVFLFSSYFSSPSSRRVCFRFPFYGNRCQFPPSRLSSRFRKSRPSKRIEFAKARNYCNVNFRFDVVKGEFYYFWKRVVSRYLISRGCLNAFCTRESLTAMQLSVLAS